MWAAEFDRPDWLASDYDIIGAAPFSSPQAVGLVHRDDWDWLPACSGGPGTICQLTPGRGYRLTVCCKGNGEPFSEVWASYDANGIPTVYSLEEPIFGDVGEVLRMEDGANVYFLSVPEESVPPPPVPEPTARGSMLPWLIGLGAAGGLALLVAAGRGRRRGRR